MTYKMFLLSIVVVFFVIGKPSPSSAGVLEWKLSLVERKVKKAKSRRQACLEEVAEKAGSTIGFKTLARKCRQRYREDTSGLDDKKNELAARIWLRDNKFLIKEAEDFCSTTLPFLTSTPETEGKSTFMDESKACDIFESTDNISFTRKKLIVEFINAQSISIAGTQYLIEAERAAEEERQTENGNDIGNKNINDSSVAEILRYISQETNKSLPLKIDNEKILETTVSIDNILIYKYKFFDERVIKDPRFSSEKYTDSLRKSLCQSTCSDTDTLSLFARGASYNYLFVDKAGITYIDYTLNLNECTKCQN